MPKTIRARFSHGVFKPMEKIEFPENKECEITIEDETTESNIKSEADILDSTFGAWSDIDCDTLKKNIYSDREISNRPKTTL